MTELELRIRLSEIVLEQYGLIIRSMLETGVPGKAAEVFTEEAFEIINQLLHRRRFLLLNREWKNDQQANK